MPSLELVLYGPEVPKPFIPHGIDYNSRLIAHQSLLAYHQDPRFPSEDNDYYSRGLTEFLQTHLPDQRIADHDLENFVRSNRLWVDSFDLASLNLLRKIEGLISGSRSLSSTCPYRNIEAAAVGRVHFSDTYLNIGGVGTNGGHEFTFIEPQAQVGMLSAMIAECLVVAGQLVTRSDSDAWRSIETIAYELIDARSRRSYVGSPSCMDLSSLATKGAQEYAQNIGVQLPESSDFKSCLMHRMNRPAYDALGLVPPSQLGRKDCISACAEQNALMKLKEAISVAQLIPLEKDDAVYVVGQDKSSFVTSATDEIIPATRYFYYVWRESEQALKLKTLTADERLLWHPVTGKNSDNLIWIGSRFYPGVAERFHDACDSFFVFYYDKVHVYLGEGEEHRHPGVGLRTQKTIPLANFPIAQTPRIQRFQIKPASLHTTGLPCLYCTKAIIENRVGMTYVEGVVGHLDEYKGDDGLSLEYLASVYAGKVRFVEQ